MCSSREVGETVGLSAGELRCIEGSRRLSIWRQMRAELRRYGKEKYDVTRSCVTEV